MRKILELKKNRETRKGKHLPYVLLVLAVFAAGLIGIFGDSTQAADEPATPSKWPKVIGTSLTALALLLAIGQMRKALLRARRASRPRQ